MFQPIDVNKVYIWCSLGVPLLCCQHYSFDGQKKSGLSPDLRGIGEEYVTLSGCVTSLQGILVYPEAENLGELTSGIMSTF